MVDCTGRYYGVALRDFWGVNQGYQLSSTIFNVVMDAVVRNWVSLVAGAVVEPDGMVREVLYCATLFYA